ncbi:MAG: T9SS type A sorting domain-containing protein [Bacteroidota bacterium]
MDCINTVAATRDKGFIVGGNDQITSSDAQIRIVKVDSIGNVTWAKKILHYSNGSDNVYDIKPTSDNGYICAGHLRDTVQPGPWEMRNKLSLIKLDSQGTVQWVKAYLPDTSSTSVLIDNTIVSRNLFRVTELGNGGYIAACQVMRNNNYSYLVIRTTANGSPIWVKTFESYYPFANVYSFSNLDHWYDGATEKGVILVGSMLDTTVNSGIGNIVLLKIDLNGNLIWEKIYGTVLNSFGTDVKQTADGGFIICGKPGLSAFNGPALIKTDSAGNIVWSKVYYNGNNYIYPYAITVTDFGHYAITGIIQNPSVDIFLLVTDSLGNPLHGRYYGGVLDEYGFDITSTTDGGLAFAGHTQSYGFYPNGILIKTDSSGRIPCYSDNILFLDTLCTFTTFSRSIENPLTVFSYIPPTMPQTPPTTDSILCTTLSISSWQYGQPCLLITPNPSDGIFQLQTGDRQTIGVQIVVYNLLGEEIKAFQLTQNEADLRELPRGIYIIKAVTDTRVYSQKVIIH